MRNCESLCDNTSILIMPSLFKKLVQNQLDLGTIKVNGTNWTLRSIETLKKRKDELLPSLDVTTSIYDEILLEYN